MVPELTGERGERVVELLRGWPVVGFRTGALGYNLLQLQGHLRVVLELCEHGFLVFKNGALEGECRYELRGA